VSNGLDQFPGGANENCECDPGRVNEFETT
jgi:hypothetical protein